MPAIAALVQRHAPVVMRARVLRVDGERGVVAGELLLRRRSDPLQCRAPVRMRRRDLRVDGESRVVAFEHLLHRGSELGQDHALIVVRVPWIEGERGVMRRKLLLQRCSELAASRLGWQLRPHGAG